MYVNNSEPTTATEFYSNLNSLQFGDVTKSTTVIHVVNVQRLESMLYIGFHSVSIDLKVCTDVLAIQVRAEHIGSIPRLLGLQCFETAGHQKTRTHNRKKVIERQRITLPFQNYLTFLQFWFQLRWINSRAFGQYPTQRGNHNRAHQAVHWNRLLAEIDRKR